MSIPATAFGYGSKTSQHVFKLKTSYPFSSKMTYECYDNDNTFPAVDTQTSTDNDIFGLGAGAENSMVGLHDTSGAAIGATSWFPDSAQSNTGSMNIMKGLTSYVTQQSATLGADGSLYWNMQCKIVASLGTADTTGFDLLFRYTFVSTTPVISLYLNDHGAGGDEATPVWTTMTSGSHGIVHCRAGVATVAGGYYANIPETGQEKTECGVVAASL